MNKDNTFRPYVVNFFANRDYEYIPAIIKSGASEQANDPRSYGEHRK